MAADSSDKEGYTPLTDFKTKKGFLGRTERANVPAMVSTDAEVVNWIVQRAQESCTGFQV